MLSLDDRRWSHLTGGYKTQFDPRQLLARLETEEDTASAWQELWQELHHQGDVGDASYAAVPHIVRIYGKRGIVDWNAYAIVAIIDLSRTRANNPALPEWLALDYFQAVQQLAKIGLAEVLHTEDPETARAMLGIVAIAKNLRTHGRFLVTFSDDELLDIESRASQPGQ